MRLKDFLRIGRAQTVPATVILLGVGFLLGGGELFAVEGLALMLIAILGHISSFGHNSVMDSSIIPEIGYGKSVDEDDDSKQNHPIISGAVSLKEAHITFHTVLTILIIGASTFALYTTGYTVLSLFSLMVWISFGYAYNNGMSIFSIWKWAFISLSFTGMYFYSYFLYGSELRYIPLLVGIYIFFRVWYQNGYQGELKDLDAPENNMLEKLGASIDEGVVEEESGGIIFKRATDKYFPSNAGLYGLALTTAECITFILLLRSILPSNPQSYVHIPLVLASLFLIVGVVIAREQWFERRWERSEELKKMGVCEIVFIYAVAVLLSPIIGYVEVAFLLIFGVLWFFGMNKFLWDTSYPDV